MHIYRIDRLAKLALRLTTVRMSSILIVKHLIHFVLQRQQNRFPRQVFKVETWST